MRIVKIAALAAAILITFTTFAVAQTPAPSLRRGTVYIPGLLPGPDRFGSFQRLCNLRVVGLMEWRVRVIESAINPNEAQKAALANLQAVSSQATQSVAGACTRQRRPETSVGELDVMGRRLDAVTQAFRTIRTAYEAFYATLDAKQKAKIDALGPQRHGWRW
jgi:hypothetical protein